MPTNDKPEEVIVPVPDAPTKVPGWLDADVADNLLPPEQVVEEPDLGPLPPMPEYEKALSFGLPVIGQKVRYLYHDERVMVFIVSSIPAAARYVVVAEAGHHDDSPFPEYTVTQLSKVE